MSVEATTIEDIEEVGTFAIKVVYSNHSTVRNCWRKWRDVSVSMAFIYREEDCRCNHGVYYNLLLIPDTS